MTGSEQGWSDYWQREGAKGEVFVNAEGESHPALAEYWQRQLASVAGPARIIDLASGAGSIYAHLPEEHEFELFAADISPVALETLSGRFDKVSMGSMKVRLIRFPPTTCRSKTARSISS